MNYFNYFTEIEERFQQRRGSLLLLSTLDWALIEAWQEAGIPLEAVLRGIDNAFDKYDARKATAKAKLRRVNSLAWCAQEVMTAVEQMAEAATGAASTTQTSAAENGFEPERIAAHLERCVSQLRNAGLQPPTAEAAAETARRLVQLAEAICPTSAPDSPQMHEPALAESASNAMAMGAVRVEDLERNLTVLEEKLFASLMAAAPEEELLQLREQAARELAPYRSKMQAVQIRQIEQQFLRKRLLEARKLPRLSLFYMSHA
ncbi:MAG: hypothetical protein ACYC46_08465 [Acidobacteriaceae bacterium]